MRTVVAIVVSAVTIIRGLAQQTEPPTPRDLLWNVARFTDADWSAVQRGDAVAKALDTDSREIAVVGAVRIGASRERLIERFQDVDALKRSALVLAAGRFSQPARPADLSSLPLEEYSLDLQQCRPSDCKVRLAENDIARFHQLVDWRAPDWRERSAAVWRDVLSAYVVGYEGAGRLALPVFSNKREPVSVASEYSRLIPEFEFVASYSREFYAYLRALGPPGPSDADHVIYWSKEDFGIRPVLRISHQVIHRIPARAAVAVATIQLYADHYLDAAISLNLAIETIGVDPGFYLITVSRARTRSLSGIVRSFARSAVRGRSKSAMHKVLSATKASLERQAH